MRTFLLIDNGSRRADSTRNLRRLAAALGERIGAPVHPVSLLHSDVVPAADLDGRAAETLAPALRRLLNAGQRELLLIPLFFGRSRALTAFVPETAAAIARECGDFQLHIAPELCPLPNGEPRLVDILVDHVQQTAAQMQRPIPRVVVVDHGSPVAAVTAVRHWLTERLGERLGATSPVMQAVMERRTGAAYDFNGALLEEVLRELAAMDRATPVILAMLFIAAGRHAGAEGDIAAIINRVQADYPEFNVHPTPLIGSHPALIEILRVRTMCEIASR
jgi:sirohydrochlorin ferrochelatase